MAAYTETTGDRIDLVPSASRWQAKGIELRTEVATSNLSLFVTAPQMPLTRLHLRWQIGVAPSMLYMGDAWERSYGDLTWRTVVPERAMPWYFAAHYGAATHGCGVLTGGAAFCFWQVDPEGVSLWLDASNGGMGVLLGPRELPAATVVWREGQAGEDSLEAVTAFCQIMCPAPRLPEGPIYGTNDWYYAYGKNTAGGILRDTDLIASLSPRAGARPFSVIDAGWEGNGTSEGNPGAQASFPDMPHLAEQIRSRGVRPGIWIRPLDAPKTTAQALLLPAARLHSPNASDNEAAYDPTVPDSLQLVLAKVRQVVDWKYDLVKHDYSTYDLFGQWGFEMGARLTLPGWHFADRSKTNAEIVRDLYVAIRKTAGEKTLLLGCNTVGHLSAGLFELQRTGDDTSGQRWERTRRMGVNTLAYRLPQNKTFFLMDADCVGITKGVPWELNRQWMDLVARSGSALFLSPSPAAIGPEQKAAIRDAFAIAAAGQTRARAKDWLSQTTPEEWEFATAGGKVFSERRHFRWCGRDGCDPFAI